MFKFSTQIGSVMRACASTGRRAVRSASTIQAAAAKRAPPKYLAAGVATTVGAAIAYTAFQNEAECHGNHGEGGDHHHHAEIPSFTTGQGVAVFSWEEALTAAMPSAAREHEAGMHGGFNEDPKTGIVYTGIPGYGLCSLSPDLKTWTKLGDDKRLESNVHGIVVFEHKGETNIAVAMHADQRVMIVGLDGTVKHVLNAPTGKEFDFAEANKYYAGSHPNPAKVFSCTDVTYLDNKLYVVTGYCPGDFVLTAEEVDGVWQWGKTAWGGKGEKPGQFQTAHGVTAWDGHIYVANREAHQVNKFTKDGKLAQILPGIPNGSRICNVSRAENDEYFLFNALEPLGDQKSAPIYAYADDHVISTIIPGDLGIPILRNVHHVWPHYHDGQLYILVHGWNQGKFAVLKHEPTFANFRNDMQKLNDRLDRLEKLIIAKMAA